jgi:CDGSH-type Zn-finger protein
MAKTVIQAVKNGPYVVTGEIELKDGDGKIIPTKAACALCRCGQSASKPFCDGTHAKVGFKA